jgi:hypothetical protein
MTIYVRSCMQTFDGWTDWTQIVQAHLRRRPAMEAQDLYKLIYQGVLGAEHLLRNFEMAKLRLQQEWDELEQGLEEAIIEPIAPDGKVVRINLRPCKAFGISCDSIGRLFLAASVDAVGHEEFIKIWKKSIAAETTFLSPDSLSSLNAEMAQRGYPVMHHSSNYRRLYRPAYRVVRRKGEEWQRWWSSLGNVEDVPSTKWQH